MIGITEPRRVAAITLASRVAQEKNCVLGEQIGYSIRFEECFTLGLTQIKYMTEGILVREMMSDPLLTNYSVIIVDEAHERTLYTDILLALLKKIIKKRPDLRIIISSATLEAESIKEYFNSNETSDRSKDTSTVMCIEGRTFPVDIYYAKEPVADYVKESVNTVIKIHERYPYGDILVFLTGQEEVENAVSILFDYAKSIKEKSGDKLKKMFVLPMYASLPSYEQMKVFETFPKSVRKVVVATNIAEASVTISGITYIVDSGFVKMRFYNPKTCTDSLVIVPTSQASAQQRAGRAGRVRAGSAFRLYTEQDFEQLEPFTTPEIQRSSLPAVILQLKALGINNIVKFDFPAVPPERNIITALDLLYALGGIDDCGALTQPLGLQMAEFPLHPMFAKMLLVSNEFGCSVEALTISAMLQVQNIFQQPSSGQRAIQARRAKHSFSVEEGDLITYLNVYNAFIKAGKVRSWADKHFLNYKGLLRAVEVRHRLESLLNRFRVKLKSCQDVDSVRKCIVSGFFANAAYLHHSGVYKTVRGDHELHIHPSSVLYTLTRPPKWVIFIEVLHTSKEFMRDITTVEPKWLYELAPHYYEFGTDREIAERNLLK
jgi:ATP-dependent RNA helicase DDX35